MNILLFTHQSIRYSLAQLPLDVLADEELPEQHLVLGNRDVIQHQRDRPPDVVNKSKTLKALQLFTLSRVPIVQL